MYTKILLSTILFLGLTSCKKALVDPAGNGVEDITQLSAFQNKIASGVSVGFFHAVWCSNCEEQRPALEAASMSTEASFATFYEMNYDDTKEIFEHYNVSGFPHILVFKDGSEVARLSGKGHSETEIVDFINQHKN